MKEPVRNLLVGTFMVVSLIIFGALMIVFGEAPSWLGGSEWELRVQNVTGLSGIAEGTPVKFMGVEIGRVGSIEFVDSELPGIGVEIVTRIKNDYSIPIDAHAKVYGATLGLGQGRVDIITSGTIGQMLPKDGSARIPGNMYDMLRELVPPELTENLTTTIKEFGDAAAAAEPVLRNIALLAEERRIRDVDVEGSELQPNLSTVIERLDRLAASLDGVLGDDEIQTNLRAVITNLADASSDFKDWTAELKSQTQRTSTNLNDTIGRTEERFATFLAQANEVLETLDRSGKALEQILSTVQQGRGTAGLLVNDPRLYEAATLTFQRLSEAVLTLQYILNKIHEEGRITISQETAVGTFSKDFQTPEGKRREKEGKE